MIRGLIRFFLDLFGIGRETLHLSGDIPVPSNGKIYLKSNGIYTSEIPIVFTQPAEIISVTFQTGMDPDLDYSVRVVITYRYI